MHINLIIKLRRTMYICKTLRTQTKEVPFQEVIQNHHQQKKEKGKHKKGAFPDGSYM